VLIPCIDLQGGQAVQLVHGRRRELAVADVLSLLPRFGGYKWLHLIDLDAAKRVGQNNRLVTQLCERATKEFKMRVRVGGGIRTARRAEKLVKLGAAQVIIGSAAFHENRPNLGFLKRLAGRIGRKKIFVALDTAKGRIAVQGWRKGLEITPAEVMHELAPYCGGFLCTDIDREGTMRGANLAWFGALRLHTRLPIVAAGGISTTGEIRALERLNMDAAVGMALYRNRLR
jgi:phosphoribosylformimino-5-aminoimidazole carboxamide ribotide isomerase